MHLVARGELLAEQAEGHLGDRHRVEGVDPLPGGGRGMGLLAFEEDVEVGHGEAGAGQALDRPGVDHHGGVDVLEGAAVQHEDFAAAPLLGGRAEHPHLQAYVVGHRGQGQPGPHGARRDDVVAAGVAHVGQRVVLGAHGDDQVAVTRPGLQCRGDVVDAFGDREPARTERLGHGVGRPGLVEAQLGRRVDRVAEGDQLGQALRYDRCRSVLGRLRVHGSIRSRPRCRPRRRMRRR